MFPRKASTEKEHNQAPRKERAARSLSFFIERRYQKGESSSAEIWRCEMRQQKRRWKNRKGNEYRCEVIFMASAVCWIVALILWLYCTTISRRNKTPSKAV
jgi:hypothetical protein